LVKKDTGAMYSHGKSYYSSVTGVNLSIFIIFGMVLLIMNGLGTIGEYQSCDSILVDYNTFSWANNITEPDLKG